ncbi:Leukocyte immunoglobulin-like receptor subfamily A member 6 [Myotis brandtii]|nr:Leukocyte immunoglobulin-like receptor subfamily A member 6 [Myotis brandtii]
MADNTTTLTFIVLLGLGDVPKPSIWADPGRIVTKGSPVTIWCQGSLQASAYVLYKDRGSEPLETGIPQDSSNKAHFFIEAMTPSHAGLYHCTYYTSGNISSHQSDPLLLVVTGMYTKPSLSAQPGPSVPRGVTVTLQCGSEIWFDTFHLHREGSLDPPQHLHLQNMSAPSQATFTLSPLTSGHQGTYRCYGSNSTSPYLLSQPSDPLELVVSGGVVPKPSIWADLGPIVTKGSPVTIWCQGSLQANVYLLYKERGSEPLDTKTPQDSRNKAGFLIEATTPSHPGLYQCAYYSTGDILSERSDPLILVVTGVGDAPSLSAQPSPVVASGGNVSLSCSSWFTSGPFHLLKEGGADPPQRMEAEWRIYAGRWRAIFPLGPVSASHGGTYRCFGSSSSNPNVWSQPSDPLHIKVTGSKPQDYTVENLIRMGVAGLVLVVLGVLLFQARNDTQRALHATRM